MKQFCKLVIATTSFGMGIDCSDLHHVIHYGLPSTIEGTGRAGRDEKLASEVVNERKQGHYSTQEMKAYVSNKVVYRWMLIYQDLHCR